MSGSRFQVDYLPVRCDPGQRPSWLYSPAFVPTALLSLTLAMFARVLFVPGDQVLSQQGMDAFLSAAYIREFGFKELRAGHIALWNPHVFSGHPFMGGFVPALFYPPNWIYLVLPLAKAMDWEIALHVFLLGFFMALWTGRYGLHPLAILLGSSAVMFGRECFFLVIYCGQLDTLDAIAWAPLILLTVDSLLDEPTVKWVLIGICALAMQILAGYPQVVFNTIVACGLYGAIRLVRAPRPLKTMLALCVIGAGVLLITAVQVWTGLETAAEGMRAKGLPLAFASNGSLLPHDLLGLLLPDVFYGSVAFFGVTGLTMAVLGLNVKSPHRGAWIASATFLVLIALGIHTPLFGLLYDFVPGFDLFRHPISFEFEALIFMALLSAFGMDSVLRSAQGTKAAAAALLIIALAVGGFGAVLRLNLSAATNGAWHWLESLFAIPDWFAWPADPRAAGSRSLILAGICVALATLFFLRASRPGVASILAVFGIAEVFAFASPMVATFPLAATVPTDVREFLAAHPGDYRILNLSTASWGPWVFPTANSAIALGASDIWGYDPAVARRYEQFMIYSQEGRLNDSYADVEVSFHHTSPLFRLLRLRFVLGVQNNALRVIETPGGLPHLLLVSGWEQIQDRDRILAALNNPSFDPQGTVILESDPEPRPAPDAPPGTVKLLSTDVNSLTIAADVARPMLLLVTDSYSRYWRAVSMAGSSQSHYQVLPADYTLIAVPLGPGHHLLRLEYAPSGWVIGRWVSLAALIVYLGVVIGFAAARRSVLCPNRFLSKTDRRTAVT
jgi:hypothetical protein